MLWRVGFSYLMWLAWYPLTSCRTVFFVLGDIELAAWKDDYVWCVTWRHCTFKSWRSSVFQAIPSFFCVTIIGLHHSVSVAVGTGIIISCWTSWSSSSLSFPGELEWIWECVCVCVGGGKWFWIRLNMGMCQR